DQALRAARLEMRASTEGVKEAVRASTWENLVETLWHDLRFALRQLRRSPGFATVAILTLALGIGANTAIFSIVDSVLLKSLPYPGVDRMVLINESLPNVGLLNDSWPDFLDWQAQNHAFEGMAAIQPQGILVLGLGEPRALPGAYVSASLFTLVGAKPFLGRVFGPSDD